MGIGSGGQISKRRAVFLDRDGVIVEASVRGGRPFPPSCLQQMKITTDARQALSHLKAVGFLIIVATNQPDVARGTQRRSEVESMHSVLREQLPIDYFQVCYHDDRDSCSCRKPKPGLLVEASAEYGIDLRSSFLVGDRWRDIEAGQAAGCLTVWIDYGYTERAPLRAPSARVTCLREAAAWICSQSQVREQCND